MFPVGLEGVWGWGSGLAWPDLTAAAGLADPPGLESMVERRALLLGGVLWSFQGLAGREFLGLSAHGEQSLVAFRASTCLLVERTSRGP